MPAESTLAIDDAGRVCVTCNQHADGWEGLIPVLSADHPSRLMLRRGDRYLAVNDANDVITTGGDTACFDGWEGWELERFGGLEHNEFRCALRNCRTRRYLALSDRNVIVTTEDKHADGWESWLLQHALHESQGPRRRELFLIKCCLRNVELVGNGAFSAVVTAVVTAKQRAVKIQTSELFSMKQEALRHSKFGGTHHTLPRMLQYREVNSPTGKLLGLIEMEHGGHSLADTLSSVDPSHLYCNPPPTRTAVAIVDRVLAGLQRMHEAGYVHLDLQPKNVLWDGRDPASIKIVDFGTVEVLCPLTRIEPRGGTWEYMPPEQFEDGPFTQASDVFWAVTLLIYLLSGRAPFIPDKAAGKYKSACRGLHNEHGKKHAVLSCPPELQPLIQSSLRFRAQYRPSVAELRGQLNPFKT